MNIWGQTNRVVVRFALAMVLCVTVGGTPIARAAKFSNPKPGLIFLKGKIVKGDCKQFKSAMKPDITSVTLASGGGSIKEGECMSRLVSSYHLKTNVPRHCASSCFMIFAAGAERSAAEDARVGVHRPSMPGTHIDKRTPRSLNKMLEYYSRYHIPEAIQAKTAQTPPASIYYLDDADFQSMDVRRYQHKPAKEEKLPAAQSARLPNSPAGGETVAYSAPAAASSSAAGGDIVKVTFLKTSTTADILEFLRAYAVTIVSGPDGDGAFRIRLSETALPASRVRDVVNSMRSQTNVVQAVDL